jgi:hypothetical protein
MNKEKDMEKLLGKKLENLTLTFSFRIPIYKIEQLVEGKTVELTLKGIKFELKRV